MKRKPTLAGLAMSVALAASPALSKDINKIGITLGSLGNPFFAALAKGAEAEAKKTNPNVEVLAFGYDYDIGKQFTQIDNFIAAGVDLILLNPGDAKAIGPAIKKAQAAGIVVVAVDASAEGADATVMTNNVQAGEIACQYIVDKLGGKGDVIIQNSNQVSAVVDRVNGCKSVFAINDPQAISTDLAARQQKRDNILVTSVDGAPDIEAALKDPNSPMIQASASQNPYLMARRAVELGVQIMNGEKPANPVELMDSKLITREGVGDYVGWNNPPAE